MTVRFLDDWLLRPLIAVFAVLLFVQLVWAQSIQAQVASDIGERVAADGQHLSDIDRRVQALENLQIDHRLTAIETLLKTGNYLQYTSTGGLLLLCAEAYIRRRRMKSDSPGRRNITFP